MAQQKCPDSKLDFNNPIPLNPSNSEKFSFARAKFLFLIKKYESGNGSQKNSLWFPDSSIRADVLQVALPEEENKYSRGVSESIPIDLEIFSLTPTFSLSPREGGIVIGN